MNVEIEIFMRSTMISRTKNRSNKLIMSKLRSKNKIAKHRIEVLEKRVQDLVGMNDELEHMISQYEREEVVFREVPKHLQLDETF